MLLVSWIDVAPNTQIKVMWLRDPSYLPISLFRITQVTYWEYTASVLTLRATA